MADLLAGQAAASEPRWDRSSSTVWSRLLETFPLLEFGYDKAADPSKEAYRTGKPVREGARERTNLSEDQLDGLLDARKMTEV